MAVASAVLAVGDNVVGLPLPGWLVHSWGLVLIIAGIVNKVGNVIEHGQVSANSAAIATPIQPLTPQSPGEQPKP
jgi:hypothetical protein